MKITYPLTFSLLAATLGCSQQDAPVLQHLPAMNEAQLAELNRNERQELERRCLGVTHPTCTALKSDFFKQLLNAKLAVCDANAVAQEVAGKDYQAEKTRQQCAEK